MIWILSCAECIAEKAEGGITEEPYTQEEDGDADEIALKADGIASTPERQQGFVEHRPSHKDGEEESDKEPKEFSPRKVFDKFHGSGLFMVNWG